MEAIDLPIELLAITAIEDAIVAAIKAAPIGALLNEIATIPADLSPEEVGARLTATPGAFVAFSGGPALPQPAPGIEGHFLVFCVTGLEDAEERRRRGSAITLGCYSLLQAVATTLSGRRLPRPEIGGRCVPSLSIGVPYLTETARYGSPETAALGLTIYGATFALRIEFPPAPCADDIADFLVADVQIAADGIAAGDLGRGVSLPLPSADVNSEDVITLPAAEPET